MQLAWGAKVSNNFVLKVKQICESFGWDFEKHGSMLMACIAFESAETFSPSIRNAAGSGAVGLIQFMPKTAAGLGTDSQGLSTMTAVRQLDYVAKYFKPYARKISTLDDMYMAILLPKMVGMHPDTPLFVSPSVAYRQNSGLDRNKDSIITKREAARFVYEKLEKGLKDGFVKVM